MVVELETRSFLETQSTELEFFERNYVFDLVDYTGLVDNAGLPIDEVPLMGARFM